MQTQHKSTERTTFSSQTALQHLCLPGACSEWDTGVNTGRPSNQWLGATGGPEMERLMHVPREGSILLATHPLRELPIHTSRWWLDLSFNECYPW